MQKKGILVSFLLGTTLLISSCVNKDEVKKVLLDNPDILTEVIEKHPDKILESLQKAAMGMKDKMAQKRDEEEKKKLEESYEKPLQANIRKDETIRGTPGAPIVLIEYSDFQCPFCGKGYETVVSLLEKYKGKIQFIYKHLPLNFHPQAMMASQYYEAIRLQDAKKAFDFHDKIYADVSKLGNGEKFLDELTKKVGADLAKVKVAIKSKEVNDRIKEDMQEAQKFDFQGTPGFLLNGIPVKGAYPLEHFEQIIEELKKRGKVTL